MVAQVGFKGRRGGVWGVRDWQFTQCERGGVGDGR